MKTTRGEIIQIEGGRSTGRKDRHSKVYTTKGPRDRRVRLAAHTAIQFYDVQDRLGYDRPSKAVDWLINNAKKAIDKLEELPPWNPNDSSITNPNLIALGQQLEPPPSSYMYSGQNPSSSSSSPFLPQSVNPESIDDTLKLFIPMSSVNFQNYPSIQTEDLCLSLQSMQDHNSSHFSGSAPANFPRMLDWNGESRVGFVSEFSQRQNLQSSFSNLIRAWDDPPSLAAVDHSSVAAEHRSSVSRSQFSSAGFSGYQVPARFHGEEETGIGSSNPSSVSREILSIE